MDMDNNKLQRFIDAVKDEIDQKVDELLSEAETEKKAILENADLKSQQAAEKRLEDSKKKCEINLVRDITKAELQMKKDILLYREKLTDEIIDNVKKRLSEFKIGAKYMTYMKDLLKSFNISKNSIVYLSCDDIKNVDQFKSAITSENVEFKTDDSIALGGFSVFDVDKGTIINKTFDLSLEEQKQLFINTNAFAQ